LPSVTPFLTLPVTLLCTAVEAPPFGGLGVFPVFEEPCSFVISLCGEILLQSFPSFQGGRVGSLFDPPLTYYLLGTGYFSSPAVLGCSSGTPDSFSFFLFHPPLTCTLLPFPFLLSYLPGPHSVDAVGPDREACLPFTPLASKVCEAPPSAPVTIMFVLCFNVLF